jgi:hypothetical protein
MLAAISTSCARDRPRGIVEGAFGGREGERRGGSPAAPLMLCSAAAQLRMAAAIGEIDREADNEPDHEPNPGYER